ncbi:hypothetical protein ACFQL4_21515 [Halosimplex aquaticum]
MASTAVIRSDQPNATVRAPASAWGDHCSVRSTVSSGRSSPVAWRALAEAQHVGQAQGSSAGTRSSPRPQSIHPSWQWTISSGRRPSRPASNTV